MAVDTDQATPVAAAAGSKPFGPVVIEVRGIDKSFQLPVNKVSSLKEQVLTFSRGEHRELQALQDVSFEINQGEFFGIVGRNGSGKSTLLKVLASIYAADSGRVRMAGRMAPFIELGVGFNPELTARENVELNGVMMGLERRQARARLDPVLEFAELEEFVDLKLKNYSSGMLVRLAFSVMIQSDAEILLIDEVLAVGDASFQQKCADVFHEMRDSDRTVILVTHDMGAVEHFCHRAMLLNDGRVVSIGEPGDVARQYLRLNFQQAPTGPGEGGADDGIADVVIEDAWLEDADGARVANVEKGAELRLRTTFEVRREVERATIGFVITNADNVDVAGIAVPLEEIPDRLAPGDRIQVSAAVENRLAPGRYVVKCWVHRNGNLANLVLHAPHVLDFVVYGGGVAGAVFLDQEVSAEVEEGTAVSAEAGAPPALELKEVQGPSSLGGGRKRFFELLWLISSTEFKKSFHGTVFGYVWSLARPLLLFAVLLVVFTRIVKLGSGVPNYPVLLLFNLVVFGLFQEGTGSAVGSVLAQEGIVRKTQFPRLVIPMSSVLVALFTLLLNLIVVFIFIVVYGVDPMWTWLLLPLILLPLFVLTSAVSLLLSALNVRFRDIAIIWTVLSTVLLYGTPLIYPLDIIEPSFLRDVLLANPLTLIFEQARVWIIDPNAASAVEVAGGWLNMLPATAIYAGVCVLGVWVFRREAPRIAERL